MTVSATQSPGQLKLAALLSVVGYKPAAEHAGAPVELLREGMLAAADLYLERLAGTEPAPGADPRIAMKLAVVLACCSDSTVRQMFTRFTVAVITAEQPLAVDFVA